MNEQESGRDAGKEGVRAGAHTVREENPERDWELILFFLAALPPKRLNYCFWDLPPAREARLLRRAGYGEQAAEELAEESGRKLVDAVFRAMARANQIFLIEEGREVRALAWTMPLTGKAAAVNIHFATAASRALSRDFGSIVKGVLALSRAPAICGLIPARYATRTTREGLAAAGFSILAQIPGACWLARREVSEDGLFYYWQRGAPDGRPDSNSAPDFSPAVFV